MNREELLHKLHEKFQLSLNRTLVAITGPAGVGKSTLAAQYAVKHFTPLNIYWINAETKELFIHAFSSIASSLQLTQKTNIQALIDQVYRNLPTNSKILFVLDNADNVEELELYLPYHSSTIHILLTTRQTDLQLSGLQSLQLTAFTKVEAKTLIKILPNSTEDSGKLAESLSFNPLAIRHAVAFIKFEQKQGNYKISDYLEAIDRNKSLVNSIAITCRITTDRISKQPALKLLHSLAYFKSQDIFLEIFQRQYDRQHIALLRELGLIRMSNGANTVSVSRFVQETIKLQLIKTNQEVKVLKSLLDLFLYGSDLLAFKRSIFHAMSIWTEASNSKLFVTEYHGLPVKIIKVLIETVNLMEAKMFCRQTLPILHKILASDHITTLTVEKLFARIYFLEGKYSRAVDAYREVYNKYVRLLGPDHLTTIKCRVNIAEALYKDNKLEEAERIYAKELNRNIRMHGPKHENSLKFKERILIIRKNSTIDQNADEISQVQIYQERGLYEEGINILKNVIEKNPQHSLATKRQLAKLLELNGDFSTSLVLNEEMLSEEPLDTDHEVQTQRQIASVLHQLGKYTEALEIYETLLLKIECNLDRLLLRRSIASVHASQGNVDKALNLYQELYAIGADTLGSDHSYTIVTFRCIGALLYTQGFYVDSLAVYENVLNSRISSLGAKHPDHLITRRGIAATLHQLQRYDEALQIYQQVLEQGISIFGHNHPDNDLTRRAIAALLHQQASSKWSDAEQIYHELVERKIKHVENQQKITEILEARNKSDNDAQVYLELLALLKQPREIREIELDGNKYAETLKVYQQMLKNGEQVLGQDHPDNLITKCCIAAVLQEQEKYDEALQAYQEVLNRRIVTLGADHPDNLVTRRAMAVLLQKQGKYDQALRSFREIYEKSVQALGHNHDDVVLTNQHIVAVQREKSKYNLVRQSVHEEKKRADNFNAAFLTILMTFVITLMFISNHIYK